MLDKIKKERKKNQLTKRDAPVRKKGKEKFLKSRPVCATRGIAFYLASRFKRDEGSRIDRFFSWLNPCRDAIENGRDSGMDFNGARMPPLLPWVSRFADPP